MRPPRQAGRKAKTAPGGRNQAVKQNIAEVMERATIHFDGGGQSPGPVTAACTVELSDGSCDQDVQRFDQGTHNTAEWQALILGLRVALKHGERHVLVRGDSMLVVKQINREWKTKDAALQALRAQAEELLALFETWRVEWIPRKENRRTDQLGRAQWAPGPVHVHKATEYVRSGISRQRRATASGALMERPMTAGTKNVFLMSCGSPEFRFPDEWMTASVARGIPVADTHINKWWSSGRPHQVRNGDIAVLVATKSGKVMGAFEIVGDPVEDGSHPRDPEKWPWTVLLRPLVLLDGTLAPLLRDFDLIAPHKYVAVKDSAVAAKLLHAIHPSL
jgi:ribonuclease HI